MEIILIILALMVISVLVLINRIDHIKDNECETFTEYDDDLDNECK